MRAPIVFGMALLAGFGAVGWADAPPGGRPAVDFARDVRPILADACFACHGPDAKTRKGDLRLDTRDGLDGRAADVLARVTTTERREVMPPPKVGKRLTAAEVDTLRRWVADGARWSGHWAFEPPTRSPIPEIKDRRWMRNPIDAFVLARLEKERLAPAAEADRETLLRRLSLDLTGLPPTPAERQAFLADRSPDAYEKVVDRLLASPHHGERMALGWLDFARYADSNGYQVDSGRQMWPWRDWVIAAYNANLPFNRFTIEQLAGDLLPSATHDQVIATGFNRNHRLNGEGGIIGEEWRVETVIDRVETTGLTWLGLTLGFARCHDHKYDPISQKEFYRLFAFFNNVTESGTLSGDRAGGNTDPVENVVTPEHAARIARLDTELRAAEAEAAAVRRRAPQLLAAWEPRLREQLARGGEPWRTLEPTTVQSLGGATLTRQADGSYLASGTNPPHDTYVVTAPLRPGPLTGVLLECLPDGRLPNASVGRYANGNFVLTGVEAEVTAKGLAQPLRATFVRAEADYSQPGWPIGQVLGGDPAKGGAVDGPTRRQPLRAMFLVGTPLPVPDGATVTVRLRHQAITGHNIGRFRLSVTALPAGTVSLTGARVPEALKQALATDAAKRTPAQKAALKAFFRTAADSPLRQAADAVTAARSRRDEATAQLPGVMVMREGPPRDAFFLHRGQYDRRGEKVTAGLPAALPPLPAGEPVNRLGLARWVAAPTNPLTARVWVNRAWERFFGTGLVKSSDNLGTQAEYPSHPELLDWLATEFVRLGWDMKAMQRLIVTSAVYRQSARVTPEQLRRDPENRLLARAARFRLPAEVVRDQALAASGLLVRTVGGPPARPYMPDGVWDETSVYGDLRNYRHDRGPGLHRRTLYTVWKRTAAPPTLLLFDAPNREVCAVRRSRTNTPLQALALLNEVTYVEAARKLAERMVSEGGTAADDRLAFGFRLTAGRQPTAAELAVLADGLRADLARYRKTPDAARQLLAFGDAAAAGDPVELAAYTLAANVLLNLDEVICRE
ncbi:MAG: PSD1 and planctomycete cytochrome C domain-containing protein [Gemmataceae bacterium]